MSVGRCTGRGFDFAHFFKMAFFATLVACLVKNSTLPRRVRVATHTASLTSLPDMGGPGLPVPGGSPHATGEALMALLSIEAFGISLELQRIVLGG